MSQQKFSDQEFTISPNGVRHTPTGITYEPQSDAIRLGAADTGPGNNQMYSREDYLEIEARAKELWEAHVQKSSGRR
jgi:hypothetical protein